MEDLVLPDDLALRGHAQELEGIGHQRRRRALERPVQHDRHARRILDRVHGLELSKVTVAEIVGADDPFAGLGLAQGGTARDRDPHEEERLGEEQGDGQGGQARPRQGEGPEPGQGPAGTRAS
jgi:hypothetical protein